MRECLNECPATSLGDAQIYFPVCAHVCVPVFQKVMRVVIRFTRPLSRVCIVRMRLSSWHFTYWLMFLHLGERSLILISLVPLSFVSVTQLYPRCDGPSEVRFRFLLFSCLEVTLFRLSISFVHALWHFSVQIGKFTHRGSKVPSVALEAH